MASKTMHGNTTSNKVDYAYNIRGWVTDVVYPYFRQTLTYNNGTTGFNGNITKMTWRTANNSEQNYSFTYDGANRMLDAIYSESYSMNQNVDRYTEKVTEYDKNGNIKKLQRYGQTGASSYGLVDNLTYTYNGNQLTKVEDATTATSYTGGTNFVNGSTATTEYTYDNNGNLTKDLNKGISSIQYNSLSLPSQVLFDNGATQTYHYTADGEKWRTVYTAGLLLKDTVDYCGGAIVENGVLKKLLTPVGYVDMSGSTSSYYYYLKDHQGNNRVVVNSSGSVVETNHYYPFGGLFAANGSVQDYKYNGKELDNRTKWYDYGARHYDATLGRWHVVDPLAEKYGALSPYGYCANNPIRLIDIGGCKIVDSNGNVIYTKTGGWKANAPSDAVRIGESMMNTRVGTTQFNKMVDADYNITLNISSENGAKKNGSSTEYHMGVTKKNYNQNGELTSVDIIIYEGTFTDFINAENPQSNRYRASVKSNDDIIGAVATHESFHATDEQNIKDGYENFKNRNNKKYEKKDVESKPTEIEHEYLRELFNMYNPL